MGQIKAVIFDMDGVLINSEPLWRQAEIETFKKVGLHFTDDMCKQTMGMRLSEVIEFWYQKTPWKKKSKQEIEKLLLKRVTELILDKGTAMKGVLSALEYFKKKGFKIALASSSAKRLINAVLNKLKIDNYFEVVMSAEFLSYGKPHPEIFIKTASKLGVSPNQCIVIEDSLHGVLSAKAALMQVIAIPDQEGKKDKKFVIADHILNSLEEVEKIKIG